MTRHAIAPGSSTPADTVGRYRDRIYDDPRHDPYQAAGKYTEPTHCGTCGAVFHRGRWQWGGVQPGSHVVSCPACNRVRDRLPAGELTLEGPFVAAHRADLLGLVRNEAEREAKEHPLHRVLAIAENDESVIVRTTDIHLPRRIGEALKRAWDGELELVFGENEYVVRAHWER
jgi:hypothetical protein